MEDLIASKPEVRLGNHGVHIPHLTHKETETECANVPFTFLSAGSIVD